MSTTLTVRRHQFEPLLNGRAGYCTHCGLEVRAYVQLGGPLGIYGRILAENSKGMLVVPSRIRCKEREVTL